jgi:hypothetical protein
MLSVGVVPPESSGGAPVSPRSSLGLAFLIRRRMQPAIAHSRPENQVAVLVVPTDEELMIAQHTLAFLPKHTAKSGMHPRDAAAMTGTIEVN